MRDFCLRKSPYECVWEASFSWSNGERVSAIDADKEVAICRAVLLANLKFNPPPEEKTGEDQA